MIAKMQGEKLLRHLATVYQIWIHSLMLLAPFPAIYCMNGDYIQFQVLQ